MLFLLYSEDNKTSRRRGALKKKKIEKKHFPVVTKHDKPSLYRGHLARTKGGQVTEGLKKRKSKMC